MLLKENINDILITIKITFISDGIINKNSDKTKNNDYRINIANPYLILLEENLHDGNITENNDEHL